MKVHRDNDLVQFHFFFSTCSSQSITFASVDQATPSHAPSKQWINLEFNSFGLAVRLCYNLRSINWNARSRGVHGTALAVSLPSARIMFHKTTNNSIKRHTHTSYHTPSRAPTRYITLTRTVSAHFIGWSFTRAPAHTLTHRRTLQRKKRPQTRRESTRISIDSNNYIKFVAFRKYLQIFLYFARWNSFSHFYILWGQHLGAADLPIAKHSHAHTQHTIEMGYTDLSTAAEHSCDV